MADPFDLRQYVSSFNKNADYNPQIFNFADFETIFAQISEAIRARQASVTVGFSLGSNVFTNVDEYDTSNPNAVVDSLLKFQEALREFVDGFLIEQYGMLPDCDVKVGFFIYENGLPITGVSAIATNGVDFTDPPNPADYANTIDFARAVVSRINEIVYALNVLKYIHGKMYYAYPEDNTCSIYTPPPPPTSCTEDDRPGNNSRCSAQELNIVNDANRCPMHTYINGTTVCATTASDDPYPSTKPNVWYKFVTPDFQRPTSRYYGLPCGWDSKKYTFAIYGNDPYTVDTDWGIRIYAKDTSTSNSCTLYTATIIGGTSGDNPVSIAYLPCSTYFVEVFRKNAPDTGNFVLNYFTVDTDGDDQLGYPSNPCTIQPTCTDICADNYNLEGPCIYNSTTSTECLACTAGVCRDSCATNYRACLPCRYEAPLADGCPMPDGVCTNQNATNYGQIAECIFPPQDCTITGCMDRDCSDWNPSADCPGPCDCRIRGCTNQNCANHNEDATVDDGSCTCCGTNGPTIVGCMNERCDNYCECANASGECTGCPRGCTCPCSSNYNADAVEDDGSCIASTNCTCCENAIPACAQVCCQCRNDCATGCRCSLCDGYDSSAVLHDSSLCTNCLCTGDETGDCADACCFGYGTKILMSDDTYKNIEDIVIGDIVSAYNIDNLQNVASNEKVLNTKLDKPDLNNFVTSQVTNVRIGGENEYYVINKNIRTTFEHPFYVKIGNEHRFVEARNLRLGYFMIDKDANYVEITSIELVKEYIKTINLSIEKYCTFIAENVIVHNEQIFVGSGADGVDPNSQLNGGTTSPSSGTPGLPTPGKNGGGSGGGSGGVGGASDGGELSSL